MMQEVKERRPHPRRTEENVDEFQAETDPMVLDAEGSSPRHARTAESWLRFVLDRIWSLAFLGVASLGLFEADFVPQILHASHANRNFVHLGILFGTLLGVFGAYIEVYRGMMQGEKVHYESAKTATHGMLVSMLLSGISLAIGMWPVWRWLTLPYLFMWSWGIVVQLIVILPPILQRVAFVSGYLWFMYAYLSMFLVGVQ